MLIRIVLTGVLATAFVGLATAGQEKKDEKKPEEKKKDAPRKGAVAGVVTAQAENWVEVKADGEEKARKYHCFKKDTELLKLVTETKVGSRIRLEWQFGEVYRITKFELLKKPDAEPGKKGDEKKDEPRKGTVTGVVSAKGDNWIEVKADGEEKGRRYVPHWRGGAPAAGGELDKDMLAKMKDTPLNSRVKIDWEFEERARVVKIEVLKKPEQKKDDAPAKETRTGTISGEIKAMKEQGNNVVIEVLAPGEEKARSYFVQYDPKIKGPIPQVLKAVKVAKVGDKVAFDWEATNHGPAIVKFELLKKPEVKKDK